MNEELSGGKCTEIAFVSIYAPLITTRKSFRTRSLRFRGSRSSFGNRPKIWTAVARGGKSTKTQASDDDGETGLAEVREELKLAMRRARSLEHQKELRREMMDRLSDAMTLALQSEVLEKTNDAIRAAADAKVVAEELSAALAQSRSSNARKLASATARLHEAQDVIKGLEKRLQYLENVIVKKDRELALARQESPVSTEELGELAEVRGCSSPEEARTLLSSLLLYPDWGARGARLSLESYNRKEEVPFHAALDFFLNELLESSSKEGRKSGEVMQAYSILWRSAAGPGRRGWKGEVLHAMLTVCNKDLISDALVNPEIRAALKSDLRVLQSLYNTTAESIQDWVAGAVGSTTDILPYKIPYHGFPSEEVSCDGRELFAKGLLKSFQAAHDWTSDRLVAEFMKCVTDDVSYLSSIADRFYGLRWVEEYGALDGVVSDKEVIDSPPPLFVGVEDIRERLCRNTEFLLNGLTAQNVLLYGGPGTGKSSMVRSLLNDYGQSGLRLVEVEKEHMAYLPVIMETLSSLPQKFILFLDDLTFENYESESMRKGKAALEGSLRVSAPNVVVYATSNRRYPVGSKYTDATEEKLAFSYRFGITLSFPRTSRDAYTAIVRKLASEAGIQIDDGHLQDLALQWALGQDGNSNGLSGRTARQFVDFLASEQALNGIDPNRDWMISSGNKGASAIPANILWTTD